LRRLRRCKSEVGRRKDVVLFGENEGDARTSSEYRSELRMARAFGTELYAPGAPGRKRPGPSGGDPSRKIATLAALGPAAARLLRVRRSAR
jgi:hypothetical protein